MPRNSSAYNTPGGTKSTRGSAGRGNPGCAAAGEAGTSGGGKTFRADFGSAGHTRRGAGREPSRLLILRSAKAPRGATSVPVDVQVFGAWWSGGPESRSPHPGVDPPPKPQALSVNRPETARRRFPISPRPLRGRRTPPNPGGCTPTYRRHRRGRRCATASATGSARSASNPPARRQAPAAAASVRATRIGGRACPPRESAE